MSRSRRFWTDAFVAAVAVVVGVAAESNSYGWSDARHWAPDLLTGWTLIACGLIARRRVGLLLCATGFSWFAGNFWSSALVLHRAPLTQLVLTYAERRARSARCDRLRVRGCRGVGELVERRGHDRDRRHSAGRRGSALPPLGRTRAPRGAVRVARGRVARHRPRSRRGGGREAAIRSAPTMPPCSATRLRSASLRSTSCPGPFGDRGSGPT